MAPHATTSRRSHQSGANHSASTSPSDRNARISRDTSPHRRTAYTLTACARCRTRKSKCDPGLPRCGPCERGGAHCEYFDSSKKRMFPRSHIVDLQKEVRRLESDLAQFDIHEDDEPDQEDLVREAAVVEFRETAERKFLGPSSGTTMTRLVMRLAKQVVGSKSIKDIITQDRIRWVEDRVAQEETKPTSKINPESYPLVSAYAERDMPGKELATILVRLYNIKVQTMYPVFYEPELWSQFNAVYNCSRNPFDNFIVRMVIAIGLQRYNTKYAGAADSYYLGALTYFEEVVKPMTLQTLQCFVLIGEYSLTTPTRTAVYYVIGLAARLVQALGLAEERTLVLNDKGLKASDFEIDMKRRVFWAVMTMDFALAHSLGRPSMMATRQDHIDVHFFAPVEDSDITIGKVPSGPVSRRKWIAIHFYKMRMLQLEIRRSLYLSKQPTPNSNTDPWFTYMHNKLESWRDQSPESDEGSGIGKTWFTGRYNTMVIFLFRPSPQVPKPSGDAAVRCYKAAESLIYMQREQIRTKSVELTWIFTQTIFMSVNAILWSLSYCEVRQIRTKESVKCHLDVALEAMQLAAERWPGVAPAVELYEALVSTCLKIFDKFDAESHVPMQPSPYAPSEELSADGDASLRARWELLTNEDLSSRRGPVSQKSGIQASHNQASNGQMLSSSPQTDSFANGLGFQPSKNTHFSSMPTTFSDLDRWHFTPTAAAMPANDPSFYPTFYGPNMQTAGSVSMDPLEGLDFEDQQTWDSMANIPGGLSEAQHTKLMQSLDTHGSIGSIEHMIQQDNAVFHSNA